MNGEMLEAIGSDAFILQDTTSVAEVILVVRDNPYMAFGFMELDKGIWFVKMENNGEIMGQGVSLWSDTLMVEDTVITPLDSKYLPETVATKSFVEELLGDIENGTY